MTHRDDRFAAPSPAAVERLIAEYPLAWIVSLGRRGMAASLAPLRTSGGGVSRLLGHLARSNPQVEQLRERGEALILFCGPNGYISPSWMSDRTQAPTWNYASVQFNAKIRFFDDPVTIQAELQAVSAQMELGRPGAWSPDEMGERFDRLARGVVAFEAEPIGVRERFKLGQDERDDVYAEIARSLRSQGSDALLDWMDACNAERAGG